MSDHGTRSHYQIARCRCLHCRAAEAQYRAALRLLIARGGIPLGRLTPAAPVWRQVRSMTIEGYTEGDIARKLDLPRGRLEWNHKRVRVSTARRVEQLWLVECGEC